MSRIGFVLLTHANPPQLQCLVQRLNSMFDDPPIVCHHDFGKCPLPDALLPPNVSFVLPHLDTAWATFSMVQITTLGLETMYRRSDSPDWCVLLSGACYPTKPAVQILADLEAGGYDAHIEGQEVKPELRDDPWHRMFLDRLFFKVYDIAAVDKRLHPKTRRVRLPYFLGRSLLPYRHDLRCYAGSHWFSVSRRAASRINEFQKTSDAKAFAKHYRNLFCGEESYFQTILYNTPGLKLHSGNWLYLSFSGGNASPDVLTLENLNAIKSSPAHFARKFDPEKSATLLKALDRIIDGADTVSSDMVDCSSIVTH